MQGVGEVINLAGDSLSLLLNYFNADPSCLLLYLVKKSISSQIVAQMILHILDNFVLISPLSAL